MKTLIRWALRLLLLLIAIPVLYVLAAWVLGRITVNETTPNYLGAKTKTIYLSGDEVHLDIVIPKADMDPHLASGLVQNANYYAFGWGDENFYLNTPTWGDLTFGNALHALLLESTSLMHVTRYSSVQKHWVAIPLTEAQLQELNQHLLASFESDTEGKKVHLPHAGYTASDDFYRAHKSYNAFFTCNTWVNEMFKKSGLKASYWTPFGSGLLQHYR